MKTNVTVLPPEFKPFKPVTLTITLESQAEVNALYALGYYTSTIPDALARERGPAGDCNKLPIRAVQTALHRALADFSKIE